MLSFVRLWLPMTHGIWVVTCTGEQVIMTSFLSSLLVLSLSLPISLSLSLMGVFLILDLFRYGGRPVASVCWNRPQGSIPVEPTAPGGRSWRTDQRSLAQLTMLFSLSLA